VPLHLAVDEQAVRRPIDASFLDVDPRSIHESTEMLDGRGFLGSRHSDACERD